MKNTLSDSENKVKTIGTTNNNLKLNSGDTKKKDKKNCC